MNLKLIVVHGRPAGKSLLFVPGEYYLGRGPECHVRFNSDWVSRQHCLLRVGGGAASLRDLGSRNGTLVNGQLLNEERGLASKDLVQIGPVVFEVRFEASAEDATTALPATAGDSDEVPPLASTISHPAVPGEK